MNQGLITFIDQSDPLLMLSKHICSSKCGIDTFYEEILRLGQNWTNCEGIEYEQYVKVKITPQIVIFITNYESDLMRIQWIITSNNDSFRSIYPPSIKCFTKLFSYLT